MRELRRPHMFRGCSKPEMNRLAAAEPCNEMILGASEIFNANHYRDSNSRYGVVNAGVEQIILPHRGEAGEADILAILCYINRNLMSSRA